MRVDDDLLPGEQAALRDLLAGLTELGESPALTPNAALQMFLAEQQVASLPGPRGALEAAACWTTTEAGAAPSRRGWHRLAGPLASLGLMGKVLLGSGIALAGVTGAGAAGALPPVLQDVWDDVADEAAPGGSPAGDGPGAPGRELTPGPRVDPAPVGVPGQDAGAGRPVLVEQQETATSSEGAAGPAPGTEPVVVGTGPADAMQDAPQESSPAVEQAPAPPPPAQSSAPSRETYEQGSPAPQTGTASGDAWAPAPDGETTAPAAPSTAPPPGTTTWEQGPSASSTPASTPSGAHSGAATGAFTGSGSGGTTTTSDPTGSSSGGW